MFPCQKIAHESPCFEPTDVVKAKFFHSEERGSRLFSVGFTANIGLE
mgnify:CR=1 FL=1